jgi:hypothetical protein
MVLNATVNNISVISWRSVLLVEKTTDLSQATFTNKQETKGVIGHFAFLRIFFFYVDYTFFLYNTVYSQSFQQINFGHGLYASIYKKNIYALQIAIFLFIQNVHALQRSAATI